MVTRKRGFEKVSFETWEKAISNENIDSLTCYNEITIPERKTAKSAGYDICSAVSFTLAPGESKKVPTGLKAYMQDDEFLAIYIRSSLGIKKDIMLKNQVGIIDADFYNNPDNEGHFVVGIINNGKEDFVCKKGDAIAQGIFQKYFTVDDEDESKLGKRMGGIGSTTKECKLEKVELSDAVKMLDIQKKAFGKYALKYGEFDSNPYDMDLHRMEFNIKYRFGRYEKIMVNDEIIGGIFAFELDDASIKKIAQFYILPEYQNLGYGKKAFEMFINEDNEVKKWYVDTILQEDSNVKFYQEFGFEIIDEEEEHEGLTFVTMLKKC
ncbi:MAG: GNAT family N-acetyltransferase [Bacilli bacterium]|nr:GNAT family N-acetyltransferase [Bacilli bacterium]